MKREFAQYLIANLKKYLPTPPETCPAINRSIAAAQATLGMCANPPDCDTQSIKGFADDVALQLMNLEFWLESLREQNRMLREAGKEWYLLAKDLAEQFPEG